MKKIGLIGYRGIVGSIVFNRIKKKLQKKKNLSFFFFGKKKEEKNRFYSEKNYNLILSCNILVICKNIKYVSFLYKKILKKKKWKGFLIDSSSFFRKKKGSTLCLNPLNEEYIIKRIKKKKKIFCGGNCTVSLMMIALKKIFLKNLAKNIYCTTFQSISGAGYAYSNKVIKKIKNVFKKGINNFDDINSFIIRNKEINLFPIIPWIGSNKNEPEEELKGEYETNTILKKIGKKKVKVFSNCVRVSSIRCHSQSIFIKTNKEISLGKFKKIIKNNKNVSFIENNKKRTIKFLNPNFISGKKKIFVGRVKKIKKKMFSVFTVGDQLIWGASEPLFKTLICVLKNEK